MTSITIFIIVCGKGLQGPFRGHSGLHSSGGLAHEGLGR